MKKNCNVCQKKFKEFLSLGNHPCADTFLKSKKKAKNLKRYPLIVGFCSCSHLTSIYPVPKHERYEKYDYSYTSDNSPVSKKHFKDIAYKISKLFKIKKNHFVVEAGSNDGTFLKEIKNFSSPRVLGVDPSKNISTLAKNKKIETMVSYFNYKTSKIIALKYGRADFLYGANVFNHVEDNLDFLRGAFNVLKADGKLILEVPDLKSLVTKVGFDTIYHEHRHYYSEYSINKILNKVGFKIFKLEKIKYMSGSIRIFAEKKNLKKEKNIKLTSVSLSDFLIFKKKIQIIIKEINQFIKKNIDKKNIIYGIGAATKGNTLLNCCKIDDSKIKYILDKSKLKINKYTPGSGIKIVKESDSFQVKTVLILPWNITNHLIKKFFKKKKISYTSIPKIIRKIK